LETTKSEDKFEEIKKIAKSVKQFRALFEPLSLEDLYLIEFPENKWVIEKLIPHQCITLVSGAPASFKTWLILEMAIYIAKGERLFDQFECEKNNVLIIDEENHLRLVKERMQSLGAEANLPIHYLSQKGFLVSEKGMIESVLKICEEKNIEIIFIDSLVRINNAEENDASQMSEVFRNIKKLCQAGKTVIITHHERKEGAMKSSAQNRLRGSSDIQASVDCHLALRRDKNDRTKVLIEQAKLRLDEEIESFEVAVKKSDEKTEFIYLGEHSEDLSKKDSAKETVYKVLEEEENGLPISEIIQKVKEIKSVGDKNIRQAIKELITENIIMENKGDGNTKICCLEKFCQEKEVSKGLLV
jgi:RecA-family ATPase